ncbi:glycosyltransferase family 10 domain-containing protein [Pedobacter hiemivivus]|uniref:Fucosyltransferase C-terminal domain-containing protein n=1 Tax=Pedobacter hiemivivus TaxID=2530454 RepID=A0A4R0N7Y6_9SPHI|nr:glycosyltransferase family 10 [Pedobacter hiemivivus]TCC96238.1 hypothetical protein EZ444_12425 [Pedobacter hiemivivus]
MKILFENVYENLNKDNRLFTDDNVDIGDNLLTPFKVLGEISKKIGLVLGTSSLIEKEQADAMVFLDYPSMNSENFQYGIKHKIPLFLITLESPIVKPEIFKTELHEPFINVLTWSDYLVSLNPKKYIKINYSYNISANFELGRRERDLIVISGNKLSKHSQELYSERLAVIKWYEANRKGYLDLYGIDWDIKVMTNSLVGIVFNKINRTFKIVKTNYPSYKGKLRRKAEVLSKYNFSLCFENASDFSGYITEKIFDSLMSGTIPIYRGADNICKYIPKSCFIDYRDFGSIEEIDKYLQSLTDSDIKEYQLAIKTFLSDPQAGQFTIDNFVGTVINTVLNNTKCS